jgi:ketosteroid isomerase-like protein
MSAENVEIVRQLVPGPDVDLVEFFSDDSAEAAFAAAAPAFADDFVCIIHVLSQETRHGVRGLREAWVDWLAPWESYRTEIEELRDAGDRVLVLVRDFGRRPDMDAEVELVGSAVWTVREGKIVRAEFFAERADSIRAFEAAGLSE